MISHIHIDPIHGKIELPEFIQNIVNTEEFQRLRNLKQLGLSYWLFPGAIHTRYEHCIGVYHLTCVLINYIQSNTKADINKFFIKCVQVAGLLHDVGHGPFSHLWDQVAEKLGTKTWSHEEMSCRITKSIFTKYNINLSTDPNENLIAPQLVSAFILGDTAFLFKTLGRDQMFLSEIVNNKFCAIDVDKWDYIVRDSYYLKYAIDLPIEFERFFEGAKIDYDVHGISHISYQRKDRQLIYQLFLNRKSLHVQCYQDTKVAIIEEMTIDALQAAEKAGFRFMGLKLTEVNTDLEIFNYFDDSILKIIETCGNEKLSEAKNLLRRVKTRNWYKHEVFVTDNIPDITNGFTKSACKRIQFISAANKTMPNTIMFHGEVDSNDELSNAIEDNDFQRTIIYNLS